MAKVLYRLWLSLLKQFGMSFSHGHKDELRRHPESFKIGGGESPVLISNVFKMSYFCRWQRLSLLYWFLFPSVSGGGICWIYSQIMMSFLFIAYDLITMKIQNSWLSGALFWTEKTFSIFWNLLGITSTPVTFLSRWLYIWNDNHKLSPCLQPTCSSKLSQWTVCSFSAKYSVPSCALDMLPFFRIF